MSAPGEALWGAFLFASVTCSDPGFLSNLQQAFTRAQGGHAEEGIAELQQEMNRLSADGMENDLDNERENLSASEAQRLSTPRTTTRQSLLSNLMSLSDTSVPFILLGSVLFLVEHMHGLIVFFWLTTVIGSVNEMVKTQVALKVFFFPTIAPHHGFFEF